MSPVTPSDSGSSCSPQTSVRFSSISEGSVTFQSGTGDLSNLSALRQLIFVHCGLTSLNGVHGLINLEYIEVLETYLFVQITSSLHEMFAVAVPFST